jgi:hypothetical protein
MESSCLDEVDDTSILKTGRPCCYRPLSRSPCPQIGARLSQLSRSDLVQWHESEAEGGAKPVRLCPCSSDVNLFRYGEGIIDFNAEIPDGALDLRMSQQQLPLTGLSQG